MTTAAEALEEVLPCPCCGYRAAIEQVPPEIDDSNAGGYYIECKRAGCGITTRLAFALKDDPIPSLIKSWNRRAALAPPQAAPAQEPVEYDHSDRWRNAAMALGERLSDVGPEGYYNFTPQQWLNWCLEHAAPSAPAQEPVAWRVKVALGQWYLVFNRQQGERLLTAHGNPPDTIEPLYPAPQPDEARDAARLSAMLLEARNEIEYLSDNEHPILARIDAAMQQTSETEGYMTRKSTAPSAPAQEPIGRVERYTGDLHDMSVIIWLGEQPPEGTLLYAAPPQAEAVALLRELEPHLDKLICYASTPDEYESNAIVKRIRAFLEQSK